MRKTWYALVVLITAFSTSCNKTTGDFTFENESVAVTFSACFTGEDQTKTILKDKGKVLWEPFEEISLFYGCGDNGGNKFTSVNETSVSKTSFQGNITVVSTGIEEELDEKEFMAVYPYSKSNSSAGGKLAAHISDTLTALAGSFPSGKMVSVAKSKGLSLAFYNVCGGIKFKVQEEGIVKVILEGNSDETLAGDAVVTFDNDGKPYVETVTNSKKKIYFYPPSASGFVPGEYYYLPFIPTQFSSGMTFTLLKNDKKGVKTYSGAATIGRSSFGSISQLDKDVIFENWDNPESETDPTRIVLHYTTTKDNVSVSFSYQPGGSYRSGEWMSELIIDGNVVSPGDPFNLDKAGDHKVIIDFVGDEIPSGFFRNTYSKEPLLTTVSIPEGYTTLPIECFNNCTTLTKVYLPESLTTIYSLCFNSCSSLETLYVPANVNLVYYDAFWGCDNLKSFTGTSVLDKGHLLVDSNKKPLAFAPCNYEWPLSYAGSFGVLKSYTPPAEIHSGYTEYIPYGTEYKCFPNDYIGDGKIIQYAAPTLKWLAVVNTATPFDNYLQDYTELRYLYLNCEYYPYTGIIEERPSSSMGNLIFCCDSLQQIDFGTGVRKISNCCVKCKNLARITFAEGLTHVGGRCFTNLPSLVEIRFPDSMKSIDEWCFLQVEALKRVYFGKSLEYLGDNLFNTLIYKCILEDVYFASSTPPGGYVPTYIPETCRIHVPTESVNAYKSSWTLLADQIEGYDFGEDYFHF